MEIRYDIIINWKWFKEYDVLPDIRNNRLIFPKKRTLREEFNLL